MVVVDPNPLDLELEGLEVLLEELLVVMVLKVALLLAAEEVMAARDLQQLPLLLGKVALECKFRLYSKIQLLHHNQDQLVEEVLVLLDTLMVVLNSSSLVEVEEVQPSQLQLKVVDPIQMLLFLVLEAEDGVQEMQHRL
jgi:hypothetical protein